MREDESPIRIGIVGAQFADPVLFVQWLARRFGLPLRNEAVPIRGGLLAPFIGPDGPHIHDTIVHTPTFWVGAQPVSATAAVPAYLDMQKAFDRVRPVLLGGGTIWGREAFCGHELVGRG